MISTTGAGSPTPTAGTTSSSSRTATDRDSFLKLLMSQMTHQDPLSPMSNQEMMQQMISIETVDGTQQLDKQIKSLTTGLFMTAGNLIGKTVTVQDPKDPSATVSGVVQSLKVDNGTANVVLDGKNYSVSTLISVQ